MSSLHCLAKYMRLVFQKFQELYRIMLRGSTRHNYSWPSGTLPFECQKLPKTCSFFYCQKWSYFPKKLPTAYFFEKMTIFGNLFEKLANFCHFIDIQMAIFPRIRSTVTWYGTVRIPTTILLSLHDILDFRLLPFICFLMAYGFVFFFLFFVIKVTPSFPLHYVPRVSPPFTW